MCEQVVCEEVVCVSKLCVDKCLCVEGAAGGGGGRTGVHNQKPRTTHKDVGKKFIQ